MPCARCQKPLPARAGRGRPRKYCEPCAVSLNAERALLRARKLPNDLGSPRWRYSTLSNAAARAERLGVPFDAAAVSALLSDPPSECPWLGIPLVVRRGRRGPSPNSPVLDRISTKKGYVSGNIQIISQRANLMRRHNQLP